MNRRVEDMDPGAHRTLRCDETRVLLMGYIDGELDAGRSRHVEDHLAVCVECRGEERAYRRLGELTEGAVPRGEVASDEVWAGIYVRLERRVGWLLMWAGLTLLGLFGAWQLLNGFLLDPEPPVIIRLGVGALAAGCVLLLFSFVRERLYRNRTERYREVQR